MSLFGHPKEREKSFGQHTTNSSVLSELLKKEAANLTQACKPKSAISVCGLPHKYENQTCHCVDLWSFLWQYVSRLSLSSWHSAALCDHQFRDRGTCCMRPHRLCNNTQLNSETKLFVFLSETALPCFHSAISSCLVLCPFTLLSLPLLACNPHKKWIYLHYNWFQSTHSSTISAAECQFGGQIFTK